MAYPYSSFPDPADNPEAGPITNIRYRGPPDPENRTGVFYNPFQIGPAQGMSDRGAGPLERAANAGISAVRDTTQFPIGAANAAALPAAAPYGGPDFTRGTAPVAPPPAPIRTRAGPSRADRLQAAQEDVPSAEPPVQPGGSTARVEQYFTPPEGPIGGPLNRGGVQIQNADGTITTQPSNAVTPQIRPQGGPASVEVINGPGGAGYIQKFDEKGTYRIPKPAGMSQAEAEHAYMAREEVNHSIQARAAAGEHIPIQDMLQYYALNGHDISKELGAIQAARLHGESAIGAAREHAKGQVEAFGTRAQDRIQKMHEEVVTDPGTGLPRTISRYGYMENGVPHYIPEPTEPRAGVGTATPPPQAIEYLKKNPASRAAFEAKYGPAGPWLQ